MDSKEFLDALNLVAKEKGIDKEVVFRGIPGFCMQEKLRHKPEY